MESAEDLLALLDACLARLELLLVEVRAVVAAGDPAATVAE